MSSHPQCIPQNFIHFGLYELEVPAGTDDPAGTMFFFYTQWCDKAKKKKSRCFNYFSVYLEQNVRGREVNIKSNK